MTWGSRHWPYPLCTLLRLFSWVKRGRLVTAYCCSNTSSCNMYNYTHTVDARTGFVKDRQGSKRDEQLDSLLATCGLLFAFMVTRCHRKHQLSNNRDISVVGEGTWTLIIGQNNG